MFLWVILGVIGLFSFFGVLFWYLVNDIWAPYGKIFEIKNFNKTGKIILSAIVTPFTIIPTVVILLIWGLMIALEYTVYGIRWLFAEDRVQLHKDWFEDDNSHHDLEW